MKIRTAAGPRRPGMQDTSITRLASSVPSIFDRFGLRSAGGAAGTEPASLRDVSLCNQISYDTRNGGGGNCTRVPNATAIQLQCFCPAQDGTICHTHGAFRTQFALT